MTSFEYKYQNALRQAIVFSAMDWLTFRALALRQSKEYCIRYFFFCEESFVRDKSIKIAAKCILGCSQMTPLCKCWDNKIWTKFILLSSAPTRTEHKQDLSWVGSLQSKFASKDTLYWKPLLKTCTTNINPKTYSVNNVNQQSGLIRTPEWLGRGTPSIDCLLPIDRFHVTSLPPCWRTISKDSSLASIVSSSNMAATSFSFDSLGIGCKPPIDLCSFVVCCPISNHAMTPLGVLWLCFKFICKCSSLFWLTSWRNNSQRYRYMRFEMRQQTTKLKRSIEVAK